MPNEMETKLEAVREWMKAHNSFDKLRDNNDYMKVVVELGNHVRLLLLTASGMIPSPNFPGYSKEQAVVVGLFVRMYKLFDAMCFHVSKSHGEIASIFTRLIFETYVRMTYLITKGRASAQNFIFVSYRAAKENLEDLLAKQAQRELIPIEKRILTNVREQMKEDGINEDVLMENRNWALDGKSFKDLMSVLEMEAWYSYLFGVQSSIVHGDWKDIRAHHIKKEGEFYKPDYAHSNWTPDTSAQLLSHVLRQLEPSWPGQRVILQDL